MKSILGSTITKILVLATPVIWIAWDIVAFVVYGNSATESATIMTWSLRAPGIAFLLGVLCGHLVFPQIQTVREYIDQTYGSKKL